MAKNQRSADTIMPIPMPIRGIDHSQAFAGQRPGTAADAVNVRSFDPESDRLRIAQRPGLVRFVGGTVYYGGAGGAGAGDFDGGPSGSGGDDTGGPGGGDFVVQNLNVVVGTEFPDGKGVPGSSPPPPPPGPPPANAPGILAGDTPSSGPYTPVFLDGPTQHNGYEVVAPYAGDEVWEEGALAGIVKIVDDVTSVYAAWQSFDNRVVISKNGSDLYAEFATDWSAGGVTISASALGDFFYFVGGKSVETAYVRVLKYDATEEYGPHDFAVLAGSVFTAGVTEGSCSVAVSDGGDAVSVYSLWHGTGVTRWEADGPDDEGAMTVLYSASQLAAQATGCTFVVNRGRKTRSQMAVAGDTLACVIRATGFANLVFVDRETGDAVIGAQAVATSKPDDAQVASDGTNFYLMAPLTAYEGGSLIAKYSPAGTVLWNWGGEPQYAGRRVTALTSSKTLELGGESTVIQVGETSFGSAFGTPVDGPALPVDVDVGLATVGTQAIPNTPNDYNRYVSLIGVSNGKVGVAYAGAWRPVVDGGGVLSSTARQIRSAPNAGKLFFADGENYTYYDPMTNSVKAWAATAGTLPTDDEESKPRLICTWRARTVLSGLPFDPRNWFMSKVNNPFDWDYSPEFRSSIDAVAGNNAPAGQPADIITALIPYSDDILIMGGDHTVYRFQGDPMAGGQIDLITDSVGVAWGTAWCKDPFGAIYFVSNYVGIYRMTPGSQPVRISQQIERVITRLPLDTTTFNLIWDDKFQGLHVFATPAEFAEAVHLFWDYRTGAWWPQKFAEKGHDPISVVAFAGNRVGDRAALLGGRDGAVRAFSELATTDDGTGFRSVVSVGPMLGKAGDDMLLKSLQAVLGETTPERQVAWGVTASDTAESASSNTPSAAGYWSGGRNALSHVRRSGHSLYVRLASLGPWAVESLVGTFGPTGEVRRRGF